jgi:hypothetical protein
VIRWYLPKIFYAFFTASVFVGNDTGRDFLIVHVPFFPGGPGKCIAQGWRAVLPEN